MHHMRLCCAQHKSWSQKRLDSLHRSRSGVYSPVASAHQLVDFFLRMGPLGQNPICRCPTFPCSRNIQYKKNHLARPREQDVLAVVQDRVSLHHLRRAVGLLDLQRGNEARQVRRVGDAVQAEKSRMRAAELGDKASTAGGNNENAAYRRKNMTKTYLRDLEGGRTSNRNASVRVRTGIVSAVYNVVVRSKGNASRSA